MTASWALIGLTELIATLADPEVDVDLDHVIGRLAETFDAEVAAVCESAGVKVALGLGRASDHRDDLVLGLAHGDAAQGDVDAIGSLHLTRAEIEGTSQVLLLARTAEPFTAEEVAFARAVGRVLGLSTMMRSALMAERAARQDLQRRVDDNRRLVSQLRERQGLLDRLFRIQQLISHRAPTDDVLQEVAVGARDLLGVERASLRLRDTVEQDELVIVSSCGYTEADLEATRVTDIADGAAGQCMREGRLVVDESGGGGDVGAGESEGVMAVPVHVNGEVTGCVTVSRCFGDRAFSGPEQEALLALAESASLALQDARAMDAMRSALNRERHRAEHDSLTGLPNRLTIRHHLQSRLFDAGDGPLTVLFVDLDRFKLTNDTLGHAFGDEVLRVVADRLRTSVRDRDMVGRLSGDEFVVVCEGMTEVGAVELAERIQAVISTPIRQGESDETEYTITASVGIAGALPTDSAEQLIANADLAMYRAKESGRARVEVFDHEFRTALEERLNVGRELRVALEEGEFVVHLQPVVVLPERRVSGFEALVRWQHPTRGLVMPDAFIPLAEETGLIAEIDRFVLDETLRLQVEFGRSRPIAVNLSARTFADPTLVTWIAARLAHHDVPAELLSVEVTETVLMEGSGSAARQVEAIRNLGVSVMIDDFGTGYSSLAYLQTFDVDGVKIDRSFTALLGTDPRAAAIVAAVLHMAAALDLVVVAEGVESDEQVNWMVELRDRSGAVELHGQGYLFGRPDSAESRLAGFVEVPSSAPGIVG